MTFLLKYWRYIAAVVVPLLAGGTFFTYRACGKQDPPVPQQDVNISVADTSKGRSEVFEQIGSSLLDAIDVQQQKVDVLKQQYLEVERGEKKQLDALSSGSVDAIDRVFSDHGF